MSSNIVLSAGIRQNLLSLQSTSSLQQTTQERLATGKKVNSALDNAVNFFTSSSLSQRANELNNLLDSMTNGINTLKAASNGLSSITTTIQSMQATVTQARQDASWQSTSYSIGSFSTSSIKYLTLANGAVGTPPVQIALNSADSAGATKTTTNAGSAFSTVTNSFAMATSASVTEGAYSAMDFRNGTNHDGQIAFTLNVDGTPHPVTITYADVSSLGTGGSAVTASELAGVINAKAGGNYASVNGSGNLVFTSPTTGTTSTIQVTGFSATNIVAGSSGIANGGSVTNGANAGAGVSFQITIGTGATQNITVTRAEVIAANVDFSSGGINSVNLTAALNSKLAAAGITSVQAIKSGTAGVSAGTDTLTLQATTAGAATSFAIASVTGGVIGSTVTAGTGTGGSVYTVDQLVAAVNNNASLAGKVKATNNAGQLQITNLSTAALSVTGVTGTTIDGGIGTGSIGANSVRANLITQFNQLKDQLDKTAADSSFNGINLLSGDILKLFFNELSTSTLSIQSTNPNGVNSSVLGIGTATTAEFQDNSQLDTRLQTLQTALGLVSSQASDFGSNLSIVQNRQEFTKNMINTLLTGSDGLTLADTNEEGANMLALQTRQQLSVTALSLASQANQSVLKLFG